MSNESHEERIQLERVHLELADEISRIRRPDRRLDCRIWLLVGEEIGHPYSLKGTKPVRPSELVMGRWFGSAFEKYPEDVAGVASNWRVPEFTRSTDAARTMFVNIGYVLWAPIGKRPSVSTQEDGIWRDHSFGDNEAMAMCAAVLRHRADRLSRSDGRSSD